MSSVFDLSELEMKLPGDRISNRCSPYHTIDVKKQEFPMGDSLSKFDEAVLEKVALSEEFVKDEKVAVETSLEDWNGPYVLVAVKPDEDVQELEAFVRKIEIPDIEWGESDVYSGELFITMKVTPGVPMVSTGFSKIFPSKLFKQVGVRSYRMFAGNCL